MPDTNDIENDLSTRVMDVRDLPLGENADEQLAATTGAILDRVLQNPGAKIPTAYFQSAL